VTDREVLLEVQLQLSKLGARIMRNAVGMAWQGELISEKSTVKGLVVVLSSARLLPFGLITPSGKKSAKGRKKNGGSSDGIGWTPHLVAAEDVGKTLAIFTAVEAKTLSYPTLTPEQRNFLTQVADAGGVALVARETEDGVTLTAWQKELD
jgi:hypothetical protein